MNRRLLIMMFLLSSQLAGAQVICVQCYQQNSRLSTGVNNLVLNGGFENHNCVAWNTSFCPNSMYYSCNVNNWICSGGGDSTYVTTYDNFFSVVPEGVSTVYLGNFFAQACSVITDDTSCLISTGCVVSGIPANFPANTVAYGLLDGVSIEQTVNGLIAGNIYVLEFWTGGESSLGSFTASGLFAVDIGFGKTYLRCPVTNYNIPDSIGTRFIIQFRANASSHTIKFTNWGHICSACTEIVLDDVRLYTLAELSPSITNCAAGLELLKENDYVVYPNPTTDWLTVKANTGSNSELIISDVANRILMQQPFAGSLSLNMSDFSKGIYFYEIRTKSGRMKTGKIIKD